MSWITPTVDDVKLRILPAEQTILTKVAADWETRAAAFLDEAVAKIRSAYAASTKGNTLGADGEIPIAARRYAAIMVVSDLFSLLPTRSGLTARREELSEEANEFLAAVSRGDFVSEHDTDGSEKGGIQVVHEEPRDASRDEMRGL